jgi:hypothetical protein
VTHGGVEMSAPKVRAAVRTATGGLLLRLLGLTVLAGLWLVLSVARADADSSLPELSTDPLSAAVSGAVEAVPASLPEPLAPVVAAVDRTVDQVTAPVQKPVEQPVQHAVGAVNETTARVSETVERSTTPAEGVAREATRETGDTVRDVRAAATQATAPVAQTSPGAGSSQPAPPAPVEDGVGSPFLQGDSRSSDAARHRSGRPVDRGATGVARAVDGPAPVLPTVRHHGVTDTAGAPQAQSVSPLPLPAPLPAPAALAVAAAAGSPGPLQQLLHVVLLGAAALLLPGSSVRVAVPRRRRAGLTPRPGTSPD